MPLREEGCTMNTSNGEKTLVFLGNSVEDSPLGWGIMILCRRSDFWLPLLRIGERTFSRKLHPAQVFQAMYLLSLFCFVLFVWGSNHTHFIRNIVGRERDSGLPHCSIKFWFYVVAVEVIIPRPWH